MQCYSESLEWYIRLSEDPDYRGYGFLGAGRCCLKLDLDDEAEIFLQKPWKIISSGSLHAFI